MANILERYGIKEVADVTFFDIDTEKPVLVLDSLKISTIEETAEQTEARGGKGNSPLIIWDYGKEITVTIQDALYSPKSMALMHAQNFEDNLHTVAAETIYSNSKVLKYRNIVVKNTDITKKQIKVGDDYFWTKMNVTSAEKTGTIKKIYNAAGEEEAELISEAAFTEAGTYTVEYEVTASSITQIDISADGFPGTYKIVGDTWARNQRTGKDEFFQFIIAQAKMSANTTITLEAEGDPSVFDMELRVLRPDDGQMMRLVQYTLN